MPYRRIWLPVVAFLLPAIFVGLLGYRWLALERDAAARRSVEAARAAATALADDLRAELRSAALAAAPILEDPGTRRAVFRAPPHVSPLVSGVFLFDGSGQLLYPAFDASAQGEAERTAEAAALLADARAAYASNEHAEGERHARSIGTCCQAARDEYGMSYLLYAAWQRASSYAARGDAAGLARLEHDLREAIEAGYLGRSEDVTALSLVATRALGAADAFLDLTKRLTQIRDDTDRRAAAARAADAWLTSVGPAAADGALHLGVHRAEGPPTLMGVMKAAPDRMTVMALDADALDAHVAGWATTHSSFDMRVHQSERSPQALLVVPLFREAPTHDLVVDLRPSDPAVDTGRGRLFASALVAALVLTLSLGAFAVRDVTREIGTAAMRSAFVASVTHELKTPVASIRLLAETLRQGRARPERTNELLDTIVEESDRLTGLVDNALTSSRIEAGAQVYHPRPVAPAGVVRAALRRFESVLTREHVELAQDLDDELVVSADPDALERSVLNLLDNAVKHSGPGRPIGVAVRRREGQAEISVTDEGPGVPPPERERIFDRFYRSPAVAADTAGAGLGLALVRHFARAHGGHAEVRGSDGRGSVFVIAIPLFTNGQDSDR